ncbi:MAG: class I SAM-dependent methyltransferase, partial [Spirochaetes bacterium]|nr:class I SAM-dependent methyltransferase [Spirochaetota bacterium]
MYNYENKEYLEKLNLKDESWYTDILNLVKKKNPKKALEVGCGDGAFTRILNKNKIKTLSIDNSKTFLDYAKKHGKSEFIQIDLNKDELNTIKEKFDAVVLLDVLEHIKNKEKVISQIKDRLKENGSFI